MFSIVNEATAGLNAYYQQGRIDMHRPRNILNARKAAIQITEGIHHSLKNRESADRGRLKNYTFRHFMGGV
jgi:hypothetical protein